MLFSNLIEAQFKNRVDLEMASFDSYKIYFLLSIYELYFAIVSEQCKTHYFKAIGIFGISSDTIFLVFPFLYEHNIKIIHCYLKFLITNLLVRVFSINEITVKIGTAKLVSSFS